MKLRVLSLLLCMVLLAGCSPKSAGSPAAPVTEPTVPAPTVPADGDPNNVTAQGSYYVSDEAVMAAADTVVAEMNGANLTNGELQIYYWLEVAAYRQAGHPVEPDFTQSLDTQSCPIDDSVNSWQQYFLREALNTWHIQQALIQISQDRPIPTLLLFCR